MSKKLKNAIRTTSVMALLMTIMSGVMFANVMMYV